MSNLELHYPDGALRDFTEDVEFFRRLYPENSHQLANVIAKRLELLLNWPEEFLRPEHKEPAPDTYRQHILYVAPDGGFSVVSLVWTPGQETLIHDHVSSCVVGVMVGREEETRYRLYEADGEQFLVQSEQNLAVPKSTVTLVPPNEDIHRVKNAGNTLAISLHVYGANIRELGSSINHRFPDQLVRAERGAGIPASWRTI